MIEWFTFVQVGVAVVAGLFGIALGFAGRVPNDFSLGALLLVEVLLVVQVLVAIIAPSAGNPPTGSLLEFWIYLGSAVLIPPAAGFWALIERTRWSTVILGVAGLAIAVMLYRMGQIWFVQGAPGA